MPGSSSWMSYAPQGVKGFDDIRVCDVTLGVSNIIAFHDISFQSQLCQEHATLT